MTTSTSRRALLGGSALGLLGAPFASLRPAFAAPRSPYSRRRFQPLLRRRFRLLDGRRSWLLTLTEISDLSSSTRGDNKNFGLTFRSRTPGPPQGTYILRRPFFTPTKLFVVPSDATRRTYQVVIFRGV
jgi:hypothetical protein